LERVGEVGLLAVLRAPSADGARRAVEALVEAGVVGIEVTYSTPDAAAVISDLADEYGDGILLGAGTVTTVAQVEEAAGAGSRFMVSPGLDDEVVGAMQATGATVMAGALTPTEVMWAVRLGVDVVKLFPGSLGGPSYLKALRGPFPEVPFMPTGGVSVGNVGEWFESGAVAVGAGSDLASAAEILAGDFDAIREKGRRFVAAVDEARAAVRSS
jgi:2-dehydro-3-deoxyphosphogluconate aldolase/(4S)-4-hydroxy-2-oxoglutarate aldolase